MARLPYVEPENAPPKVKEAFDLLPVKLNIFKMLANAETHFRPLLRLGAAILSQQELDPKLRELAILQAAKLTPGEYEWVQHVPIAKAVGATDAEIEALERGDLDADCFGDVERLMLAFGEDVLLRVEVADDRFAAMQKHFSPREIVEIVITLGYYSMLARLTEVTHTDVQAPVDTAVVDAIPEA